MSDKYDEHELGILKRYSYRLQDLQQWYYRQHETLARDKQEELQALRLSRAKAMPKLIRTRGGVLFG